MPSKRESGLVECALKIESGLGNLPSKTEAGLGKCAIKTKSSGREMCVQQESQNYGNVP